MSPEWTTHDSPNIALDGVVQGIRDLEDAHPNDGLTAYKRKLQHQRGYISGQGQAYGDRRT